MMDWHDALSAAGLLFGLAGAALGLRRHDAKKHQAKLAARRQLGLQYARAAWDVVRARNTAPGALRGALLDAFRLADTALDGKRDFSDAQAQAFIDEVGEALKGAP